MRAAWALVLACAVSAGWAGGPGGAVPVAPVPAAGGARFQAEATVLLGADDARGAELGYRLRAALLVRALPPPAPHPAPPTPPAQGDLLLHFTLESPQLMLRGKQLGADFLPRPSLWDDHPSSEFLAQWSAGRITETYLDSKDPPDVLNFKKALISLFQYQVEEGERNETDISGECEVQYEAVSPLTLRKFKHRCMWEGSWDADEEREADEDEDEERGGELPGRTERRRATRLELREDGQLEGAVADDLLLLRAPAALPLPALKARAHTALRRLPAPPAPPPAPPAAAPAALLAALAPHTLSLRATDHVPDDTQEESLEEAVRAHRAALEDDAAGTPEAAAAVLALLPAVRRASAPQLAALLANPDTGDIMEGLARVLGLSGAAGAHAAARDAFQLASGAPPRPAPAQQYLAALALAPRVEPAVLRGALALAGGAGPLAPHALLAVAAAARRHGNALQTDVKDYVLKSLAKCKDESCRETRLLALGQLRRGDVGALLLDAAERGGRAGLAALAALEAGPRAQRRAARRRLAALALGLAPGPGPAALELRAAALALLLREGPAAAAAPLTAALRRAGPRELRRLCWQTLLASEPPPPRDLLPALDPRPRDWCKRAYDGTSSVVSRALGALRLHSSQLAERGVLRRGVVDLRLAGRPLLTVEIWARGLESLAPSAPAPPPAAREPEDEPGAAPEPAPEPEDASAGIALTVAGVRRPDLVLFESQTELLGHVWAGTGSTATGVLRALVPRAAVAARALSAGLLVHSSAETVLALKLDAQAVVSLWGRSARGGLALRGAGAARRALRVRTAWGRLHAHAHAHAAPPPALLLDAALDFYDAPQLCVHAAQPDHGYTHNVTLESEQGARAWRVRRHRVSSVTAAGRTLALGAANDAACAALAQRDRD